MAVYERCATCGGNGVIETDEELRYCSACDGQGDRPVRAP